MRYNYRLRPGAKAELALISEWHRTRFLWNDAVERAGRGEHYSFAGLCKLLTSLRGQNEWLRDGSTIPQQQVLRQFSSAVRRSFTTKGVRRPKFKSVKTSQPMLKYTSSGFSIHGNRMKLAKGISVPVVFSRPLPSPPSSVSIKKDSLGHWYASFVVIREITSTSPARGSIGIDWGVKKTATTTDSSFDLDFMGTRESVAHNRAKAQKKMARRHKGGNVPQSKGYRRAKLEAARITKKSQGRNVHESRSWAKRLVEAHQLIAIEDFRTIFLGKTTMAKKASDAAISVVKRTLIEYAERAGRTVVLVQPAHTTMTCSECFARAKRLKLDERTFSCASCGYTAGRDENAARTILAVAERGHTSVEGVRRSMPSSDGIERGLRLKPVKLQGR